MGESPQTQYVQIGLGIGVHPIFRTYKSDILVRSIVDNIYRNMHIVEIPHQIGLHTLYPRYLDLTSFRLYSAI